MSYLALRTPHQLAPRACVLRASSIAKTLPSPERNVVFGWSRPKCPLDPAEQAWVERRMQWLAERVGWRTFDEATIVLPTNDFFPDAMHADDESLQRVFDRVCEWMEVDPTAIDLVPFDKEDVPEAGGLYEAENPETGRTTIYVCRELHGDIEAMVAVLAHELAHHRLLGGGLQAGDDPDTEHVTDLFPIIRGLGVFGANAVLREHAETIGGWFHWGSQTHGYLPARTLGYALALFAHARGERKPDWARWLRPDAKGAVKAGLRYLARAERPMFGPNAAATTPDDLDDPCPARRVSAMWNLADDPDRAAREAERITANLEHDRRDVRLVAAQLVARVPALVPPALPQLTNATCDTDDVLRRAALGAIRTVPIEPEIALPGLRGSLERHPVTACEAAASLAAFGPTAEPFLEGLERAVLRHLPRAGECEDTHWRLAVLVDAVRTIDPNGWQTRLRDLVADEHDDVRTELRRSLRAAETDPPPAPPAVPQPAAVPWTSQGWAEPKSRLQGAGIGMVTPS